MAKFLKKKGENLDMGLVKILSHTDFFPKPKFDHFSFNFLKVGFFLKLNFEGLDGKIFEKNGKNLDMDLCSEDVCFILNFSKGILLV